METDMSFITFAILTVSDSCFEKTAEDLSGNALEAFIVNNQRFKGKVLRRELVPDEIDVIKDKLINICDSFAPDVILTTGGTGFSSRDVTPEATKSVIEKEAPGLSLAMLEGSLKITSMAMLSRPVCGIRDKTLIINLPGSRKGSTECLEIVSPALPHAVHLLRDDKQNIIKSHAHIHTCQHSVEIEHGIDVNESINQPLARRVRKSPYPAISVKDALKIVLGEATIMGRETLGYTSCNGRVLAEDIFSKDPLPPFPASIKDGYAVIAADGSGIRKVLGAVDAGTGLKEFKILPGQCVRINTGAPIPNGADCVVQVEDTKLLTESDEGTIELEIEILSNPKVGQDIRRVGSDIAKGQKVLSAGSVLGYSEQSILAAVGVTMVTVYKLPVVGILSTGNELVDPAVEHLEPGKIRDSNKTLLISLINQRGFKTVDLGIASDNKSNLIQIFEAAIDKCDVIISSGGVSMGDKDLLKPVLISHFGAHLHFGRVFMKPGLPTTFMTTNPKKCLIFALPGNPVSAAVTCTLFAIPALKQMAGHSKLQPTIIKAKIRHSIVLDPRPEYQRVVLQWNADELVPSASIMGNQISSRLLSMVTAEGLLILPPSNSDKSHANEGEIVDCMLF